MFFVLRKKQSQVTFLHVYHHVNVVFSTWAYLRFIKGNRIYLDDFRFGASQEANVFTNMSVFIFFFLTRHTYSTSKNAKIFKYKLLHKIVQQFFYISITGPFYF